MTGVSAALDGSGSGADAYVAVFLFGAVLVLAALVIAIVQLVRGGAKALAWLTIVLCALPVLAVIALAVQARG